MTLEQVDEHFRSLENHRNAIKVLVARIEAEQAKLPEGDKLRLKLEECSAAFAGSYAALDDGVAKLDVAKLDATPVSVDAEKLP